MNAPQKKKTPLILVTILAGLSMGNESCEKAQSARTLKMDVEVGSIGARPVRLPSGEVIDFAFVANSLFYQQVMASNHFVITNAIPQPASLAPSSVSIRSDVTVSSKAAGAEDLSTDEQVLERFGFMEALRDQAHAQSRQSSGQLKSLVDAASIPACLYDLPQAIVEGEVITFEATWGAGVGIGYDHNGVPLNTGKVAASVNFNNSRLEMGLRAEDPLKRDVPLATAQGVAHQSKVGFGLDLLGIPLGLDLFFKTPLADVVRKAMDKGLTKIVDSFKSFTDKGTWDDAWESRVVYDPVIVDNDTHVAFRAGYRAGVKKGDTFTVTNMHYKWKGVPCESALDYKVPFPAEPIADLEVVSVGDNISVARVLKYHQERNILPGAQIKILQLKVPETVKKNQNSVSK